MLASHYHAPRHQHGTMNHTVANDLAALQACNATLTRLNVPVLGTCTGGAMPVIWVARCRGLETLHREYGGRSDCATHWHAVVEGCRVEWETPR